MKKFILVVAAVMLLVQGASAVSAAEFMAPDKGDDTGNVLVSANETRRNLYTAGAAVMINGRIAGDLFAAGGSVDVTNEVEKDAVIAGGNITIDGVIGEDLRVGGGNVRVNGRVGGDVLAGAGTLIISDRSSIGGDLIVGGGTVTINAPVSGNIMLGAGGIIINSEVRGTITIAEGNEKQDIVFGPNARVNKLVIYGENREIIKRDGAQVVDPEYRAGRVTTGDGGKSAFMGLLIQFLASIAALLVLIKLFPRRAQNVVSGIVRSPWAALGWGFVGLIVVPIAAIIAAILFIGYYITLLLLVSYVLLILLACLAGVLFAGAMIIKWLMKKPQPVADWQAAVIGVVVVGLLALIPVLGWIICGVLFLMGFGSLLMLIRADIKQQSTHQSNE